MSVIQKNNKKLIRSWAMFDWANSAYNLVITSTIFPVYYTTITNTKEHGDVVRFFGIEFVNTALSNFALAVAYLVMALTLPFISSYADANGKKKQIMKFFTTAGAIACMGLFFFKLETLEIGIICFVIAAMGYIGGVLFNNSYLPLIASVDQQDKVSAQGFSYGYVGCVTLQILCFIVVLKPEWFGISDPSLPARISFLMVGVWWLGFSLIPFKYLPHIPATRKGEGLSLVEKVKAEITSVWRHIQQIPEIKKFLPAFFFYSIGVQTLMIVASAFGEKVLHLGATKLIGTILLIQLVAIAGAFIMSAISARIGNVKVLMLVVVIWISICISAYFLTTEIQFYILAALVGLVMGGIQSLSRSTFSKLIPEDIQDTTAFFSFYDVTEKIAIVVGLFSFAMIEQITHNIRYSALSLSLFFIIGLLLLVRLLRYNKS
ncbi:MFS transporter [Sphingobacterium faecium NBRC 15299]|jgi:UMF1 family MFS transporter|uniref:MFS transporter n=1 Tax=Sphingobacterium faecium TaxID=34087 RepID=UPI000D393372|nr:MFS transporter [Sphingobacterium faecium]PTX13364.1 UMF1 family MFS transporter [Sphingobacterium faecium]GEM66121.1 MFS transporter [Sphingobacterium faecium NBRC 15299]